VTEVDDINDELESLTRHQEQFSRNLARLLAVDAAGLATMEHLMFAGPATPTELARELEISTAATTLVIDRLEAVGHVTRSPHPTDGRKIVVTAAASSVDTALGYLQLLIDGLEEVAESLPERDRAIVANYLGRTNEVFENVNRKLRR
jgi:DNA-binding MarR family transcriptional regulator